MYVDPPELIVQNDDSAELTRVAYTIAADGTVTFADPQVVKVTYVAARAAAAAPTVTYASHAESRPGQRPTPAADSGSTTSPATPAEVSPNQKGAGMDPAKLREALSLPAEASDIEVQSALATAGLITPAADPRPDVPAVETPAPTPELVAAGAGQALTVTVDRAQWEATIAAAQSGQAARDEQLRERRESLVATAVSEGRIAPAQKASWLTKLEAEGTEGEKVLSSLAKGLVPIEEIGHGTDTTPADDGWFPQYGSTTAQEG
jgi:hypothetical protein